MKKRHHNFPPPKYTEKQQKAFDRYVSGLKQDIETNLRGKEAEKAYRLLDMLKDHMIIIQDNSNAMVQKISSYEIIELAQKNIDFNRLENIIKDLDPTSEENVGYHLSKIMQLSDNDYNALINVLGKYSNNISYLSFAADIKIDKIDRVKTILNNINDPNKKLSSFDLYALKGVTELSDEAWNNIEKRDLFNKLKEIPSARYSPALISLANMNDKTWEIANKRNLLNEKALKHIDALALLEDVDFCKLISIGAFNPETVDLRIPEKFISEFINLDAEQQKKT